MVTVPGAPRHATSDLYHTGKKRPGDEPGLGFSGGPLSRDVGQVWMLALAEYLRLGDRDRFLTGYRIFHRNARGRCVQAVRAKRTVDVLCQHTHVACGASRARWQRSFGSFLALHRYLHPTNTPNRFLVPTFVSRMGNVSLCHQVPVSKWLPYRHLQCWPKRRVLTGPRATGNMPDPGLEDP